MSRVVSYKTRQEALDSFNRVLPNDNKIPDHGFPETKTPIAYAGLTADEKGEYNKTWKEFMTNFNAQAKIEGWPEMKDFKHVLIDATANEVPVLFAMQANMTRHLKSEEYEALSDDEKLKYILAKQMLEPESKSVSDEIHKKLTAVMDASEFNFADFAIEALTPSQVTLSYVKEDQMMVVPTILFANKSALTKIGDDAALFKKFGVKKSDVGVFHQGANIIPEKFDSEIFSKPGTRTLVSRGRLSPLAFLTTAALNLPGVGGNVLAALSRAALISRGVFPIAKKHYDAISSKEPDLDLGLCSIDSKIVMEWYAVTGVPSAEDLNKVIAFTKAPNFSHNFGSWILNTAAFAGYRHFKWDHYYLSENAFNSRTQTELNSLQVPDDWKTSVTLEMWSRTMLHPCGFTSLLNFAVLCDKLGFLFTATQKRAYNAHYSFNAVGAVIAVLAVIEAMPFGKLFSKAFQEPIDELKKLHAKTRLEWLKTTPLYKYYGVDSQIQLTQEDNKVIERLQGSCAAFVATFAPESKLASAMSFKKDDTQNSASYITFMTIWKSFQKGLKGENPQKSLQDVVMPQAEARRIEYV